jgi:myo-inositol catabolism protein IolC
MATMEQDWERLSVLATDEELIKISNYLDGDSAQKRNIASVKLDAQLKAYLQDCKYNHQVRSVGTAIEWLEQASRWLLEQMIDTKVINALIKQLEEFKDIRERISATTSLPEKDKLTKGLQARGLWEI